MNNIRSFFISLIFLIYVAGLMPNQEIMEQGKTQYQILKDRETIPRYGTCWRSAIEHLDMGCRILTEDIQSDIALHLTNCFLDMSGHETYNCELDKKRNLRAICISSMSDRAFNVYTEFYTHTQNICWFLQGQVWQEIISEGTIKVGKQLKESAANQEGLLQAQKESLELQGRMLKHGQFLEQVLEDLYASFKANQEVLNVLSGSVSKLQTWVVGEISWLDSVIFYAVAVISIFMFTASERVQAARFPTLLMLLLNVFIERLICATNSVAVDTDISESYNNIYCYVWISRYAFIALATIFLIYSAVVHENPMRQQHKLLCDMKNQNDNILRLLISNKQLNTSNLSYTNEILEQTDLKISNISGSKEIFVGNKSWRNDHENGPNDISKAFYESGRTTPKLPSQNKRYNLRSNTPII